MTSSSVETPRADALVQILFIQGAGQGAHEEDAALVEALREALGARLPVSFPEMPNEADPDSAAWKRAIADEARRVRATVVVAHSAGAAITADMVMEGRRGTELPRLRGLFLLAPPFVGPGGWALEGFHFDRAPSPGALDRLAIHFYFGQSDTIVPAAHADLYAGVFPDATFHRVPHCDHQFAGHLTRVAQDVLALVAGGDAP
jgi:predicted alpha/beta hydrolase family esterase